MVGGGGGPGGALLKIGGLLVLFTSTKTVLFKASFGTSCTACDTFVVFSSRAKRARTTTFLSWVNARIKFEIR